MFHGFLRFTVLRLVRLYYPRIEVRGEAALPRDRPLLFVLNHPNGLLDPLLLIASVDRPVAFLAKSTFFANPFTKLPMDAFGALPVYRRRYRGKAGGPRGDTIGANERTFSRCRALLRQGGALALFPEGTTHSGATMLPLRSGAARIALGAEAEHSWQLDLEIVPVGIWYENKTLFRSGALLSFGGGITVARFAEQYTAHSTDAVKALTRRIREALDEVVLQAEQAEALAGMPWVADWTAAERTPPSLSERHRRTAELLAAYVRLRQADPARATALADHARRFARTLQLFGIDDPWAVELAPPQRNRPIVLALLLVATSPLALAGLALSYGPYRLAGQITPPLVGQHDTLLGTGKLFSGAALVLLGWLAAAVSAGLLLNAPVGIVVLLCAPLLSYTALRWGEGWRELRSSLAYGWLRSQRRTLVAEIIEGRHALAADVADALRDLDTVERNRHRGTTVESA